MNRVRPDDREALRSWILERVDHFPSLAIVDARASADEDSDGEPMIILTVHLNPPVDEDDTWPTEALLPLYRAVRAWGREAGYPTGPHVHLQSTRPVDAG